MSTPFCLKLDFTRDKRRLDEWNVSFLSDSTDNKFIQYSVQKDFKFTREDIQISQLALSLIRATKQINLFGVQ